MTFMSDDTFRHCRASADCTASTSLSLSCSALVSSLSKTNLAVPPKMPKRSLTTSSFSLCKAMTSALSISVNVHGGIKHCPEKRSAFLKCSVLEAAVSGLRADVIHKDWQKTPFSTSMSASMIYKACAGAEYKVLASTFFGSSPF